MTDHAKQQAAAQFQHIAAMMEAQRMDWDRFEELRDMRANHEFDMAEQTDPKPWEIAFPDEAEELADLEAIAGEWDNLEDVQRDIDEHPLSVEYRSGWGSSAQDLQAEEFQILLCTGGPAVRIVGELDFNGQPHRAWLEYQDWGTPWTQYFDADNIVLVDYAMAFVYA